MSASCLDAEELFKEKISCTKIYTSRFLRGAREFTLQKKNTFTRSVTIAERHETIITFLHNIFKVNILSLTNGITQILHND